MKFIFRSQVQPCAFEANKQSVGFRDVAVHAVAVVDAAERFLRDQLLRKRERFFSKARS